MHYFQLHRLGENRLEPVRDPPNLTKECRLTEFSTADVELSAKFDQELRLEKESRDTVEVPANVQAYLSDGPFEV